MKFVIFDFCETLVLCQTHDEFIRKVLTREKRYFAASLVVLGGSIFGKIIQKLLRVSFKSFYVSLLKGLARESVADMGDRYALYLHAYVNENIIRRLRRYDSLYDDSVIVVISGGLEEYIVPFMTSLMLNSECVVLANRLADSDGRIIGRYTKKDCMGREKVSRFHERFGSSASVLRFYSDSHTDFPMFEVSDKSFFVEGSKVSRYEKAT